MQNDNRKNPKGFTLIELLIAIFVLSVGMLGAYVAIQKSASIASYSYNRLIAAYLAQEGIEIVRNVKDTNLLEDFANPPVLWNEGLDANIYQAQYSSITNCTDLGPSLLPCSSCDDFTQLAFLMKGNNCYYNYADGVNTIFKRKVSIIKVGEDELDIAATVYWKDGTQIREFKAWDKFYNWW